ncbi:hypothetical protein H920_06882 [Fukomys damarensis]|uniref:Uncharacterized protein n=1 Tax=Fukomys damarensis TaxID=885580 RepID=A0A091DML0_FUKDA|nr:hypothetical protein H920_06882 [Fukomys damarensis]
MASPLGASLTSDLEQLHLHLLPPQLPQAPAEPPPTHRRPLELEEEEDPRDRFIQKHVLLHSVTRNELMSFLPAVSRFPHDGV